MSKKPQAAMPTETGTAFLVDQMGGCPRTITKNQYETIDRYLKSQDEAVYEAVEWLLWRASITAMDEAQTLAQHGWHYCNTGDHSGTIGVLSAIHTTGEIEDLTKEETEMLQDTLYAIRAGGWFPQWLALQVSAIANGERIPGDRHPTPLQIAASLTLCAQEYNESMETAREFARMRPDLLLPEPPATPEPPAAEETAQPTSGGAPTSSQGARKPRKKVAHA